MKKYRVYTTACWVLGINKKSLKIFQIKQLSKGSIVFGQPVTRTIYNEVRHLNVSVPLIMIGNNEYVTTKCVEEVSVKADMINAEGLSPLLKYQVLTDLDWFTINSNGFIQGQLKSPNSPSNFRQGDIIQGREKKITYKVKEKDGDKIRTGIAIEMSGNKYVNRNKVAVHSGGKPTGADSFSGAEGASSKVVLNEGVLVMGVSFGLLGTGLGILIGASTNTVIAMAGTGVVIGAFVGHGYDSGESKLSATGGHRRGTLFL